MNNLIALTLLVGTLTTNQATAPKTAAEKIEPVAVAGCLKESAPDVWTLVNASDPVVSTANSPSPKEIAALPAGGKNEFRLIGVAIFDLPAHRNHAVVVKGLPIKATPVSRLNMTSLTMVSATCPAPGK